MGTLTFDGNAYSGAVAFGDVHGASDKLSTVLEMLPANTLKIFVGDLIHKGQNSKEVVDIVRPLVEAGEAIVVRGNHESMAGKEAWVEQEDGLTDEDRAWLKSRPLFLRVQDNEGQDHLFLHAGIDQGSCREQLQSLIDAGHLPETGEWTESAVNAAVSTLSKGKQRKLEKVMFIRYLTEDGVFIPLGKEDEHSIWWGASYRGEFGHIWYGHQPHAQPRVDMHSVCLDTEAYKEEGTLTAMDVVSGDLYTSGPIVVGS